MHNARDLPIPLRGQRLVEKAIELITESGMSHSEISLRYGVGITWFADLRAGRVKSPSADTIQMVIEDLTGNALFPKKKPPPERSVTGEG